MAAVAPVPMRASNSGSETNRKVPLFPAEATRFENNGNRNNPVSTSTLALTSTVTPAKRNAKSETSELLGDDFSANECLVFEASAPASAVASHEPDAEANNISAEETDTSRFSPDIQHPPLHTIGIHGKINLRMPAQESFLENSASSSMQEIFPSDDTAGSSFGLNDEEHGGFQDRLSSRGSDSDEWFTGDRDALGKPEVVHGYLPSTPPLSLHPPPIHASNKPYTSGFTIEIAPNRGALDKGSTPSSLENGRNTPLSFAESQTSNGTEGHTGSVGSNYSSVLRPGSTPRPILYSAIGSLENLNAAPLRNLHKSLLSGVKGFNDPDDEPVLLPPQSHISNQLMSYQNPTEKKNVPDGVPVQTVSEPKKRHTQKDNRIKVTMVQQSQHTTATNAAASIASNIGDQTVPAAAEKSKQAVSHKPNKPSNLRSSLDKTRVPSNNSKRVSYNAEAKKKKKKKPVEMFRPSCDAYTPRIEKKSIKYRAAESRTPVQKMASPMGTLQRPNFRDALRRVAMIIHQHILKIEKRFEVTGFHNGDQGLFRVSMKEAFSESNFSTPKYKCTMVRIPMARPGMVYGLKKIKVKETIPSEEEIYEFAHQLFKSVQLSSECSIVCLIYVERLMETAKVPLLACTWRPIFMCGLLLASKVWQDLSSWNIEFASVYPQFSLDAINRLELSFLRMVKWDLYISSSLYAKYYFALRSLVEKRDFRQRYNRMVGGVDSVAQSEALKIQKRTELVKEEALLQLSRSM